MVVVEEEAWRVVVVLVRVREGEALVGLLSGGDNAGYWKAVVVVLVLVLMVVRASNSGSCSSSRMLLCCVGWWVEGREKE